MKLEFKVFECLCSMKTFRINNIEAETEDFGDSEDENPGFAEQYGCGNRQFRCHRSSKKILKKYAITQDEYDMICKKLESGLSFGECGWCA